MDKNSLLYELVQEKVKSLEAEKEKREAWKKSLYPKFFYLDVWTYGRINPNKQLETLKGIVERAQVNETHTEPCVLVKDIS